MAETSSWMQLAAARYSQVEQDVIFFHIGYWNFQSWQFCGLQLQPRESGVFAEGLQSGRGHDPVVFLRVPDHPVFERSLEFFKDGLRLINPCQISFLILKSSRQILGSHEMIPGLLEASAYSDIPDFVWKGLHAESQERARVAAATRRPRTAVRPQPGPGKGRGRVRAQAAAAPAHAVLPAGIADVYSDEEILAESSLVMLQEDSETDASEEEVEMEDGVPDMAAADGDGHEAAQPKRAERERSSGSASAPVPPQAAATVAVPKASVKATAKPKAKRAAASSRARTHTEEKIELGDIGSLVWYPHQKILVAHCGRSCHEDCRRQRSLEPHESVLRQGQGRPLGLLVAWLKESVEHDTRMSHVKYCTPSFAKRKAAREWFARLSGAQKFLDAERPKREAEGDEPVDIL